MNVDLVLLGEKAELAWSLGEIHHVSASPHALAAFCTRNIANTEADAWLFWDAQFGQPDETLIASLLARKVDVWHAGLKLGMAGLPKILDFFYPVWVFNRDPSPEIEASSWRLSLQACLIKTCVIHELGFVDPAFQSLDAAGLELGYRYLQQGVFLRHTPRLLPENVSLPARSISFEDELLFIHLGQSRRGKYWSLARAVLRDRVSPVAALRAVRKVARVPVKRYAPFSPSQAQPAPLDSFQRELKVTVLIPTVERYPYLRTLLDQLRNQSIKPLEILVIDQTEDGQRDLSLAEDFADLPLRLIYQNSPGQCSSRNTGLKAARGDFILFLDDDDEIPPNLIEQHLENLFFFDADTSSGGVEEAGALPLTGVYARVGLSDVFPTNNTLIRKEILKRSGLFDLAYERGQSADGDLGMRIYLAGGLMVYNPRITVFHHRAPRGGLRKHKARVITYASSRQQLFHRRFPHVTECYRMMRYFTPRQTRETMWLSVAGTFSIQGNMFRKLMKTFVALLFLPNTIYQLRRRMNAGSEMLKMYPQIPEL